MNESICSRWARLKRSLAAAETIVETDPDSAASRAYCAAFHGVTAVLAGRGMEFTTHTAVRAALHRDRIQSGAISADLGRDYDFLLDLREAADHGGVAGASLAGATKAIKKARAILVAPKPLLRGRVVRTKPQGVAAGNPVWPPASPRPPSAIWWHSEVILT